MPGEFQIAPLEQSQVEEAGIILGEALMVEPGYAAVIPDESLRRATLVGLMTDGLRRAISSRSALAAINPEQRVLGVALWAPPQAAPRSDDVPRDIPTPPSYLQALPPDQLLDLMRYDDACEHHFPDQPIWYLQILGVDPAGQGNGIGSALMRASLEMVDRTGLPAYLETGTERNVRFYERFGFAVREADLQLAPHGPTHWTMLRPSQATKPTAS